MKHRYKIGDKVILNLHTDEGAHCITESEHGKKFIVYRLCTYCEQPGYDICYIEDFKNEHPLQWAVVECMLSPINEQLLFSFMYEK